MSQESESPLPPGQPTRELLLAQALDACIQAERRVPGSADLIIAHQPAWARTDLRRLVALAGSLDAAATNAVMSEDFRQGARARLLQRVGGETHAADGAAVVGGWLNTVPSNNGHHVVRPPLVGARRSRWMWRSGAGALLAAMLGTAATLTASANALPGEPLYSIKQVREELGLRLAPDDQTRALVLLGQGDARLDETARLLQLGRTADVAQTTQRFDEVLNRATTTLVVTIADTPAEAPTTARIETTLANQEQQIQSLLLTAPEPARSDLRGALVTAERSRALVADQQSSDRALDRGGSGGKPSLAAPEPPMAVESEPAVVPEPTATPLPQLAQQQPAPADRVADKHDVAAPSARDTANARESRAASPHNRPNTDQVANDVAAEPVSPSVDDEQPVVAVHNNTESSGSSNSSGRAPARSSDAPAIRTSPRDAQVQEGDSPAETSTARTAPNTSRGEAVNPSAQTSDARAEAANPNVQTNDTRAETSNARADSSNARAESSNSGAESGDARTANSDTRAAVSDTRAAANDTRAVASDNHGVASDNGTASDNRGVASDNGTASDNRGVASDNGTASDNRGVASDNGTASDNRGVASDNGTAGDNRGDTAARQTAQSDARPRASQDAPQSDPVVVSSPRQSTTTSKPASTQSDQSTTDSARATTDRPSKDASSADTRQPAQTSSATSTKAQPTPTRTPADDHRVTTATDSSSSSSASKSSTPAHTGGSGNASSSSDHGGGGSGSDHKGN